MQPTEGVGVGVRFVARVDHRTGTRGGRGDGFVQEVRTLGDLEAVRSHAAGAGEQLTGDEERQQLVLDGLQRHKTADQIVLVATESVTGGVNVVLEHVNHGALAVSLTQFALRLQSQIAHDLFAGEILSQSLARISCLGGGVFGVGSDIQIQA